MSMEMRNLNIGSKNYEIVDKEARDAISGMKPDITALKNSVGGPLIALTSSGMTDTSKVYVYTGSEGGMTAGNWYFYDGTDWTSGGVYNATALSTDTTLAVSGAAADAKKTGDEITALKNTIHTSRIRDKSIIFELPFGGHTQSGNASDGYSISSSTQTLGLSEIKYATKPIVFRQKDPTYTGITVAVQIYGYNGSKYSPSNSAIGWFDTDGKNSVTIMAGQYYWIGFRDGNNPYQITVSDVSEYYEIFETEADYGYGSTSVTIPQAGSNLGAMSIATQYAEEEMYVTCDDWDHFAITYATYASANPNEILTSAHYASERLKDFVIPSETYYRLHIFRMDDAGSYIRPTSFNQLLDNASQITVMPLRVYANSNYINNAVDITGTKSIIASLAKRLDILEKANSINTIPSYYQTHISGKVSAINSNKPTTGGQFIFITDIHVDGYAGRGGNSMNSHALINYICQNTTIKRVFNGGDLISNDANYTVPRTIGRIRTAIGYAQPDVTGDQFYVVGNHDAGLDYDGDGNTISTRHITAKELAVETGVYSVAEIVTYDGNSPFQFSFDDDVQKIRYIVLDIGERDNATDEGWFNSFRFFANALNTTPANYFVVVFNHQSGYSRETGEIASSYYQYIYNVLDAYKGREEYSITSSVGQDFTNAQGEPVCVICGHHHEDFDFETTDGIPIILTTTDNGGARKLNNSYIGNVAGTVNEQAFDVFSIDTTNRTIKTNRVGYGSDRTFEF